MTDIYEIKNRLGGALEAMGTAHQQCLGALEEAMAARALVTEATRGSSHGNPPAVQQMLTQVEERMGEMAGATAMAEAELHDYILFL